MKEKGASWEKVAHHLVNDNASDVELADRLESTPQFVARVRADLGMAKFPRPLKPQMQPVAEVFAAHTVAVGDHLQWSGRTTRDGTPVFSNLETAYRVAFRLEHGQEPQGLVRVACTFPRCVRGAHLTDRVMREARREVPA
ncbi:hypothetical protein [Streptomyces sp. NRRL B-1347]|uniref:hypothetical protein n=1 Tax=Streptomyces sp. NRRL B-1347 TaxID=1476877 RepID=UPI0004CB619F|nr:hypothetical protein [Streptomyces sp. NRRL B-1347]